MKKIIFIISLSIITATLTLMSCSEDRNFEQSYSTHVSGWMDLDSPDFHGKAAMADSNQGCASCHDLRSAYVVYPLNFDPTIQRKSACVECHNYPHPEQHDPATVHEYAIFFDAGWDLTGCNNCHGTNFAGGRTGVSCLSCHDQQNGPANCTNCHGLPPIDDHTVLAAGFLRPVGAAGGHQVMAVDKGYACTECHASVTDLSHTGPLPAEVTFANAVIATAQGYADTAYIHVGDPVSGNGTCAVYCHSNGRGGPPNQSVPEWTSTDNLSCTACHSIPPVAPHPQFNQCHNCHDNVDPGSIYPNDIRFINEQLHVNGVVEL